MQARDANAAGPAGAPEPRVIRRQDYKAPSHRISTVALDFTLGLESTRVINTFDFEQVGATNVTVTAVMGFVATSAVFARIVKSNR